MFRIYNLLEDESRLTTSNLLDKLLLDGFLDDKTTKTKEQDYIPNYKINYDYFETDNEYVIELAIPGFEKDAITIDLNNKKLVVSGERKLGEDVEYIRRSTLFGKFKKEFTMPDNTDDDINADFNNGVLRITIKKVTKNKKIKIK